MWFLRSWVAYHLYILHDEPFLNEVIIKETAVLLVSRCHDSNFAECEKDGDGYRKAERTVLWEKSEWSSGFVCWKAKWQTIEIRYKDYPYRCGDKGEVSVPYVWKFVWGECFYECTRICVFVWFQIYQLSWGWSFCFAPCLSAFHVRKSEKPWKAAAEFSTTTGKKTTQPNADWQYTLQNIIQCYDYSHSDNIPSKSKGF